MSAETETKKIKFKVARFDPQKEGITFEEHELSVQKGTTVLDALIEIKEERDNTLAFRYSCRMGICGSCGMYINGLPRLGCQTQVLDLRSGVVRVRPIPNFDVVRDLVPDLTPLFEKEKSIKPYIIRKDVKELEEASGEYLQTPENLSWIYQFTCCIKCGLCLSACPTVASDPLFTGPQALAQAYRYMMDMRDEGFVERMEEVDHSHGCWRCHFASSCAQVCPKGVDPALGIQLLKREILLARLRIKKKREGSTVLPRPIKDATRNEKIPAPPPKNVDQRVIPSPPAPSTLCPDTAK